MRARRGGFVLVAALWLLIALGAVGLDAALRSRTRRLAAANILDESRARAIAVAGTEYARSRLTAAMLERADELRSEALQRARTTNARNQAQRQNLSQLFRNSDPAEDPWRQPDELVAPDMAFGDAQFTLRVRDTGASLNLNQANESALRNFFAQGLRVDAAVADKLAQAILDWRDEDENARINGGERDQYLEEDAPVLPPNRDFAELDELRHVMGMTPELYEAALPYLTLVGSGDVNVNAAPEPVLLALPGMTPSAATELLRLREAGTVPRNMNELRGMLPMLPTIPTSRARYTTVSRGTVNVNGNQIVFESTSQQGGDELSEMTTFTTNEVEIIADGGVQGSPIHVRARVVVTRSNTGAVVVWRRID